MAFDEGSGSALTNHAPGRTRMGAQNGVIENYATSVTTAAGWGSDAVGSYLDLYNGGTPLKALLTAGGIGAKDLVLPEGAAYMVFTFPQADGGLTRHLMYSGTNATGVLRVTKLNTGGNVRLAIEAGASDPQYDWTGLTMDATTYHRLFVRWNRTGVWAYLNGTLGTPTNSPSTYAGGVTTRTGLADDSWVLGSGGAQPGIQRVYIAAVWDCWLNDREKAELEADWFAPIRATAVAKWRTCIPIIGRPTTTGATARIVAADGLSGTAYVRVKTATTAAGVDAGTVHTAVSTTTANASKDVAITGLSANTRYWWMAEWSADGSTYYPMPGGVGELMTMGGDPTGVVISDDHICANTEGDVPDASVEHGLSIIYDEAFTPAINSLGQRKTWHAWKCAHAVYENESPHFVLWGGDNMYMDTDATDTLADVNAGMFDAATIWINRWWLVLKLAANFFVLGNHEKTNGFHLFANSRQRAPQKQATIVWKRFVPNPDNTTYKEGGETGSQEDAMPAEAYADPPDFTALTVYALGDVVKPTTDNYFAYECTTAGTSAGSEPTWGTTVGGTTTSGTATFTCRERWDDTVRGVFVNDAGGENTSPLLNYYGFQWGGLRVSVLDVCRYTTPGSTDVLYRDDPGEFTYGPTQRAWLLGNLKRSGASHNLIVTHNLPGGEYVGAGGTGNWYGRGTGLRVLDDTYWPKAGKDESPEEIWLHNTASRYGAVIAHGHDHRFALVSRLGVTYVSFPTPSAPNHYDESQTYPGWNFDQMAESYGTVESFGAVDAASNDLTALGMVKAYNTLGYLRMEYATATGLRFTLVRTSWPTRGTLEFKFYSHLFESDRFIANQSANKSSNALAATDALNPTVSIKHVGTIANEADLTGSWWSSAPAQQYSPSLSAWAATTAYLVNEIVRPTTFSGLMARCVTAGTTGGSDPFGSAVLGDTIADGTAEWLMEPIGLAPTAFEERAVSPLPVDSGSDTALRAEVTPLAIYQSGWLAPAPIGGQSSGGTVRRIRRRIHRLGRR